MVTRTPPAKSRLDTPITSDWLQELRFTVISTKKQLLHLEEKSNASFHRIEQLVRSLTPASTLAWQADPKVGKKQNGCEGIRYSASSQPEPLNPETEPLNPEDTFVYCPDPFTTEMQNSCEDKKLSTTLLQEAFPAVKKQSKKVCPPITPARGDQIVMATPIAPNPPSEQPVPMLGPDSFSAKVKKENGPKHKWMTEDHHLDVTHVKVKENTSLSEVFMYDTNLESDIYRVEDRYNHSIWADILLSSWFTHLTTVVVACNVIYLGIDSEWNHVSNVYDAAWPFLLSTQLFCTFFTTEIVIRFFAFAKKKDCLQDGWFTFDLFLVATMIFEIWMLMPLLFYISDSHETMHVPTQPLRMLRLLKLTRMARLMQAFPELIVMIKALLSSLRAIASSMILIGLMSYVWGIFLHSLFRDEKEFNKQLLEDYDYTFTSMMDCIWVLLFSGTLMLDNTAPFAKALLFSDNFARVVGGFAFILYLFLSALLILQMLVGVLCDVLSQLGHDRHESEAILLLKQELLGDLRKVQDERGNISKVSLKEVLESPASKATLKKLKINRPFLINIANLMFHEESSVVPVKTILELMLMCKGDKHVNVSIISSALCFLTNEIHGLKEFFGEPPEEGEENDVKEFKLQHSHSSVCFFDGTD
jgi:hypothetical protein